eukprot:TRINITY_DN3620_c0_g1_i1.p1 TRINITY_DN3620_c0_g1~~TRINITY_DN3620_c0_g1_i1.p1  ORF type:complete len:473 (-),score=112.56 TRINITY_DN3620_c0_g1_i1:16-1317(-)
MSLHFGGVAGNGIVGQSPVTPGADDGGSRTRQVSRIKDVRAYVVSPLESGGDYHRQQDGHWIVSTMIANPMSIYEQYKTSRLSWGIDALGTVVVEVELEDGTVGFGTSVGGEPACFIVEKHFSRFVIGQDPRNVELMWDQMWRASLPYGRKGVAIHALSAVDLALWDVLGKVRNEPVYALLGGKTKERLPMYCTSTRPDCSQELGFKGAKFPLPFGPGEGDEGMRKNIDAVRRYRESVSSDFPLMIDCYMALTVPYAIELINKIAPYNIKWIEEFLPPDEYDGYAKVKKATRGSGVLLTTGEHEYTRYGFRQLLQREAVDVLQPDVNWVGGITEARRVVALASAFDIPVIPHGSSVFSYHLQTAFTSCPMQEFLNMSPNADKIVPMFGQLFIDEPLPKDGYMDLPDLPGWGVELNKTALDMRRPYLHAQAEAE